MRTKNLKFKKIHTFIITVIICLTLLTGILNSVVLANKTDPYLEGITEQTQLEQEKKQEITYLGRNQNGIRHVLLDESHLEKTDMEVFVNEDGSETHHPTRLVIEPFFVHI